KISALKNDIENSDAKDLAIYLNADDCSEFKPSYEASNWNYSHRINKTKFVPSNVTAQLQLLNWKQHRSHRAKKLTRLFETPSGYGYPNFIDLETVLDPNNGYCKNDTIVIEANIVVEQ
ncbi:uncharacterized protein LOC144348019, partial [Saccoglossus kowalevskii]